MVDRLIIEAVFNYKTRHIIPSHALLFIIENITIETVFNYRTKIRLFLYPR